MKHTLTPEFFADFFWENSVNSEKFSISNYNQVTLSLIEKLGLQKDPKFVKDMIPDSSRPFNWVNDLLQERYIENLTMLEIFRAYPTSFKYSVKECNYPEFIEVFNFLTEHFVEIKWLILSQRSVFNEMTQMLDLPSNEEVYKSFKTYLNAMYGVTKSLNSEVQFHYHSNTNGMTEDLQVRMNRLISELKENLVYIETDTLYIHQCTPEIVKIISKILEGYQIEFGTTISGIFFHKHKYLLTYPQGRVVTQGIKHI